MKASDCPCCKGTGIDKRIVGSTAQPRTIEESPCGYCQPEAKQLWYAAQADDERGMARERAKQKRDGVSG